MPVKRRPKSLPKSRSWPECGSSQTRSLQGESGITLIEVLVVVALLGFLTSIVFGGVVFGTRASRVSASKDAAVAEIEAVHRLLDVQLSRAQPAERSSAFRGTADQIVWAATPVHPYGPQGLQLYSLSVTEDEEVTLSWRPYRPSGGGHAQQADERVLLEDISKISIRYLRGPAGVSNAQWEDSWLDRRELPLAVRITFLRNDPAELAMPEVFVRLLGSGRVDAGSTD